MSYIIASLSLLLSLQFSVLAPQDTIPKGFTLKELPEYVVVRSEGVKMGANRAMILGIDHKKTRYEKPLFALQEYLENKDKRAVRSQSELLTVMSEIGFDYINAYQVGTSDMVNVVFRKKEEHRGQ